MMMQKEIEHLLNEKEVLLALDSPFIIRLATCWQDPKLLYMLLEPCMGGELRTVMHSFPKNQMPEKNARFYAACIVLALRVPPARCSDAGRLCCTSCV